PFSMWPRTLMKVVPEICELLIAASAPTSWGRRYFSRRLKKISDKAQDLRQRNRRVALLLRALSRRVTCCQLDGRGELDSGVVDASTWRPERSHFLGIGSRKNRRQVGGPRDLCKSCQQGGLEAGAPTTGHKGGRAPCRPLGNASSPKVRVIRSSSGHVKQCDLRRTVHTAELAN